MEFAQPNLSRRTGPDTSVAIKVVCGWCGRVLRDSRETGAITSHGLCPRCANVLEGRVELSSDGLPSDLEQRVNVLMCQVYQTKQLLIGLQRRLNGDAELSARLNQALLSIREQERVVAGIQQKLCAMP